MTMTADRARRGQMAHHAGSAAEESVARYYRSVGCKVLAQRWQGPGGEIDLIVQNPARVIFVEVKKSRSFEAAAVRLSAPQMARICASAEAYLGTLPEGTLTEARFDVALVDASGAVQVIKNAFGAV